LEASPALARECHVPPKNRSDPRYRSSGLAPPTVAEVADELGVSGDAWPLVLLLERRGTLARVDDGLYVDAEELERVAVCEVGRVLRHHPAFGRAGSNVNFAAGGKSGLRIRTYERGVEDETLACGTGAAAAALLLAPGTAGRRRVRVRTAGGATLVVRWRAAKDGTVSGLSLEGPARIVFTGIWQGRDRL